MNEQKSFIKIMLHNRSDLMEIQKQGKAILPDQPEATISDDIPHKGGHMMRSDGKWLDCLHLIQELPPNMEAVPEYLGAIEPTAIKDKDGFIILQKEPGVKTDGSPKDLARIRRWVSNL